MRIIQNITNAWVQGLIIPLPSPIKQILGCNEKFSIIEPTQDGFLLFQSSSNKTIDKGVADQSSLKLALERLEGPKVLLIPDHESIKLTLNIPETGRRSLNQLLESEVERLTPFKTNNVRFAYDIISATKGQLRIDVLLVPKIILNRLVESVEKAGCSADLIMIGQRHLSATTTGNILLDRRSSKRNNRIRVLSAIFLFTLLTGVPLSQISHQEWIIHKLSMIQKEQEIRVQRIQKQTAKLDRLSTESSRVIDFFKKSRNPAKLLETITRAVPDDAWIFSLIISPTGIKLEGYARDASSLLLQLAKLTQFQNPVFQSPIIKNYETGLERFSLSADFVKS